MTAFDDGDEDDGQPFDASRRGEPRLTARASRSPICRATRSRYAAQAASRRSNSRAAGTAAASRRRATRRLPSFITGGSAAAQSAAEPARPERLRQRPAGPFPAASPPPAPPRPARRRARAATRRQAATEPSRQRRLDRLRASRPRGRRREHRLQRRHQRGARAAPESRDRPAWSPRRYARPRTAPNRRAGALPGHRRAQEPAARDRRHVQRLAPAGRREPGLAQQRVICEREYGRPWPNGVVSMRAHTPRRFGITASSRPPAASTRHTSRSIALGSCDISSACTSSTRSTAASASGRSSSSTSAASVGRADRPFHHALRRRHEGEAALRLLAKQAEIGRRVADAEQRCCRAYRHSARGCRGRRTAAPRRPAAERRNCADRRRRATCAKLARSRRGCRSQACEMPNDR